jgi:hypothetical protein
MISALSFYEALSSARPIPPYQSLVPSLQNTPIQTNPDCCMELAAAIVRRSCGSASTQLPPNRFQRSRATNCMGPEQRAQAPTLVDKGESVANDASALSQDFLLGAATASYQIEGAVHEDGRCRRSGTPSRPRPARRTGDTGDVACDHYHRYEAGRRRCWPSLGFDAYRFSIAWPRVMDEHGKPTRRARLLQAPARPPRRPRASRPLCHAVPLGPAAAPAGSRRLAQPRHRVPLRRLRRG